METKLFDQWDTASVVVSDRGLQPHLNINAYFVPYSFGRVSQKKFGKSKIHIVERLANDLMGTGHLKDNRVHKRISGRDSGKKQTMYRMIRLALMRIEKKTNQNPLQILVQAVENTAPREETTRIRQGGIIVHKSVDVAPARRVDLSMKFISHGAAQRCFRKKQTLDATLAEEILAAANSDIKSYSVSKRDELERVAQSAR